LSKYGLVLTETYSVYYLIITQRDVTYKYEIMGVATPISGNTACKL